MNKCALKDILERVGVQVKELGSPSLEAKVIVLDTESFMAKCSFLSSPDALQELQDAINDELQKAGLPGIRIRRFKLPEEALEWSLDRDSVSGKDRDKLIEIFQKRYKQFMRKRGLRTL